VRVRCIAVRDLLPSDNCFLWREEKVVLRLRHCQLECRILVNRVRDARRNLKGPIKCREDEISFDWVTSFLYVCGGNPEKCTVQSASASRGSTLG
jgi:hypothetical protein